MYDMWRGDYTSQLPWRRSSTEVCRTTAQITTWRIIVASWRSSRSKVGRRYHLLARHVIDADDDLIILPRWLSGARWGSTGKQTYLFETLSVFKNEITTGRHYTGYSSFKTASPNTNGFHNNVFVYQNTLYCCLWWRHIMSQSAKMPGKAKLQWRLKVLKSIMLADR